MWNFLNFQVLFVCSLVEIGIFKIVVGIVGVDKEEKVFFLYEKEFLVLERCVQVFLDILDVLLVEKKVD